MAKGIFVVGTDTDVGKTVVTAGILHVLRSMGHNAAYFKAALSGAEEVNGVLLPGDTALVCEIGRLSEPYENMTPYIYQTPVSPHLAAKLEGCPIEISKIKRSLQGLSQRYDLIIAEGSGGVLCPLIEGEAGIYTFVDLILELKSELDLTLDLAVVVVARSGVGTINHTVLTTEYLKSKGIEVAGIIINGYVKNPVVEDNIIMIERMSRVPVIARFEHIHDFKHLTVGGHDPLNQDREYRNYLVRKAAENSLTAQTLLDLVPLSHSNK